MRASHSQSRIGVYGVEISRLFKVCFPHEIINHIFGSHRVNQGKPLQYFKLVLLMWTKHKQTNKRNFGTSIVKNALRLPSCSPGWPPRAGRS